MGYIHVFMNEWTMRGGLAGGQGNLEGWIWSHFTVYVYEVLNYQQFKFELEWSCISTGCDGSWL